MWRHGEHDQLRDRERGLSPGDTLTSDSQTPELLENQYPICGAFLCQP